MKRYARQYPARIHLHFLARFALDAYYTMVYRVSSSAHSAKTLNPHGSEELMAKVSPLKNLRDKLGLTQQKVAYLMGVSLQTVWRWEHSKDAKQEPPAYIFDLLPILAAGRVPDWCKDTVAAGYAVPFLAQHVLNCSQCKLVTTYLAGRNN
jgi:DNA-binding transcriptional regulator YiaG